MTTTTTKKTTRSSKSSTTDNTKLPTNPFQHEILALVSSQRSNAKKIELLQEYVNPALKSILIWNFDESVISLLPEGDVPYADANDQTVYSGSLSDNLKKEAAGGESATGQDLDGRGRTSLRKEFQNLYHFVKGGNMKLNNIRREMMFINLLRALHPMEAELLILVKDKNLQSKYKITKETVAEAYPDIQWGGRS
jgi:hypothetical protein